MSVTKQLGTDLALWHDYRAGHAAHQAGYAAGSRDGVVYGTLGRFRTGVGFETIGSPDPADPALITSHGYIQVADNAAFYPPADGMCIVASFLQSNADGDVHIIGQGEEASMAAADISWVLVRTPTSIVFATSDGAVWASLAYNINAVPGQVETITVRYTGGTGANNCTISVLAPTPSTFTGQVTRVPQDIAVAMSMCCSTVNTINPLIGTMRYVAYVRGAKTAAILTDLAVEMEDIGWPTTIDCKDSSGSVADRKVQYMSKFGVDASIADETAALRAELSNSRWVFDDAAGTWRVAAAHIANAAAGSPADVQKVLYATKTGKVRMAREYFSADVTATSAAYGTWDFWVYHYKNTVAEVFVVHDINGANDDGYVMRIKATIFELLLISGGVETSLKTTGAVLTDSQLLHLRVTRTAGDTWNAYYQICTSQGVPGPWVSMGSVVDATITTSDGLLLNLEAGNRLLLGNQRSEKAFFKWKGVVNPL